MSFLEIKSLTKNFSMHTGLIFRKTSAVRALQGISLTINRGETLGLVGESGCGKTTLGRCLLRLIEPDSGQISFEGRDVLALNADQLRDLRREIQIIFQDPYASLNPRMTVGSILSEPLEIHNLCASADQRKERVSELLERVGLRAEYSNRYPHEFSGGQRQRIGIARALAVDPKVIVCDEPVSALDVSVQAQVINLLKDLQKQLNLTYLFIAHDLNVVQHISDRVAVMYLGKIVEVASSQQLYQNPKHPYTKALLSAIPVPDPRLKKNRTILPGDVPSPMSPPSGCQFHPRCPIQVNRCQKEIPQLREISTNQYVSCFEV